SYSVTSHLEPIFTGGTLQFSSSAQHIFCTFGTKVQVVDIKTGAVTTSFDEDEDIITCLAVTPDDKWLLTCSQNLLLRQWNWQEKSCTRAWKSAHVGPVVAMEFDASSTLLATGSSDSTIKIWDISSNYYTHNLKGSQGVVNTISFHPDPAILHLFSAADDYKIRQWDLKSSKCIRIFEGHYSSISSLAFSHDGKTLLSGGRDNVVNLWDIASKSLLKTIPTFEIVESVVVLPSDINFPGKESNNSMHYITVGNKGVIRIWRANDSRCVHQLSPSNFSNSELAAFTQISYLKPTNSLALVTFDHNVMIYDVEDLKLKKLLIGHNDEIVDASFVCKDDSHIVVATNSPDLRIFQHATMSCQMLFGHTDTILSLDVSYDRQLIATSSKDHTIRVWKAFHDSFRCVAVASGHTSAVPAVAFSRLVDTFIVSGSNDYTMKVWTLPASFDEVWFKFYKLNVQSLTATVTEISHKKDINSIDVSPNDKLIATASQDKTAKVWLVSDGSLLGSCVGHKRGLWSVQFSPIDQCIATCSSDSNIKIWSVIDFTCVKTFEGHSNSVLKVSFVTRGMQLLSSDSDGLIKLWTIKSNECENTFDHHTDKVWAIKPNSTEEYFVSGGADSSLAIWKDMTAIEREKKIAEEEELIAKEQELSNLLHAKKFTEALNMAIGLEKPFLTLTVVKTILDQPDGLESIDNVIQKLDKKHVNTIFQYLSTWNTNAKHSRAAQIVLSIILKNTIPEDLIKMPSMQTTLEALIPYTERHYQRLERLLEVIFVIVVANLVYFSMHKIKFYLCVLISVAKLFHRIYLTVYEFSNIFTY
ncbi:uncharacterized protein TRIADDRAFT_23688, partial [Trichoplax adhaerens]